MAAAAPGAALGAAADRAAAGRTILEHDLADVFVLDDGFQHWSLARTLDVVCVDVSRPWERFLLPLGLLREPASALGRAGVVLLTRCDLAAPSDVADAEARVRALAPDAAVLRTSFEMTVDGPPRGDALAVSGIGHPAAFEAGLVKIGYRVTPFRFPDHHAYTDADLDAIERRAKALGAIVITTGKDWVKLAATRWSSADRRPPLRVAGQTLRFLGDGETVWRDRIASALLKAA
jgi:tetraacyldisaccharide 4'-kinase